ncbi:MAG: 1-acyl-sn-glycerol-3-phosphate acyltransferase [Anaerolineae bacterium]|nr:1-acyl-sn-glycerol-3-phosphate acyltransferase [Anaerolineae bacterium]
MNEPWLRQLGHALWPYAWGGFLHVDVGGQEHIPPTGPLIVSCNHVNFLDPFVIDQYVGRPMVFFAKVELYESKLVGPLARQYMMIPVRRGEGDAEAIKSALRVLHQGYALYLAPEGHRSGDGTLLEGKVGSVMLASRVGCPVVPAAVWGHAGLFDNVRQLRPLTHMRLRFGEPYRFVGPKKPARNELDAMAREMMYRIAIMLPEQYRGPYSDAPPPWQYTQTLAVADNDAAPTAPQLAESTP